MQDDLDRLLAALSKYCNKRLVTPEQIECKQALLWPPVLPEISAAKDQHDVIEYLKRYENARLSFVANSLVDLFVKLHAYLMDQPKR